ncbi:MAG: hypothetical protein NTZ94_13585 [Verrucomicrobia bacterium]|nr:hypothetical protein [Verrucomicrobiota bacterium]
MTQNELGKKLNTSKSNVQRMASLGMPTDSEQAARAWIEQRSKDNPQAQAAQTLAEQRREKIRLECALLALRLQREQENSELLPTTESLAAIRTFCRLALISLKTRIDASAERVAACQTPQAVHRELAELVSESWITSSIGMTLQVKNDSITRMAHEMIQSEFVKITPAMIQSWEF